MSERTYDGYDLLLDVKDHMNAYHILRVDIEDRVSDLESAQRALAASLKESDEAKENPHDPDFIVVGTANSW
jgi:hypothetical protein